VEEEDDSSGQLKDNRPSSKRKRADSHSKIDDIKRGKKDSSNEDDDPPSSQTSIPFFFFRFNFCNYLNLFIGKGSIPKPEEVGRRNPHHHPSSYPSTPLASTQRYSSSQHGNIGDIDDQYIDIDHFNNDSYPDEWFDDDLPAQLGMVPFFALSADNAFYLSILPH
jgi:hypothetical protein